MTESLTRTERFKLRDASSYDPVIGEFESLTDRLSPPLVSRLVALAKLQPSERVLDIGTGTGIVALAAARRLAKEGAVLGVDLSDRMIDAAREKASRQSLACSTDFQVMDAEALTLGDAAFDAVLSLFALLHFPNPLVALAEMRRVLRPGGRMVLAVGSRPPLLSLSAFGHRVRQLPRLARRSVGRRVTAPALLDRLAARHFPDRSAPEQSELAERSRTRTSSVVELCRQAGFTGIRSHWEGHEALIESPEDFWELQRTFSSFARKRLEGRTADQIRAVQEEFTECCRRVQSRGGELAYPFAAFYVIAERPAD